MPRKREINVRPYASLRSSSIFLLVYSFSFAFTGELAFSLPGYVSAVVSTASLLAFGVLARKSFDQMAEDFSLAVKVFPILVVGQVIFLVSYFADARGLFSILELVGELLVLAYLLELTMEVLRLSSFLNLRELKVSGYVLLAALVGFVVLGFAVLGFLVFGFLLTIASLSLFYGLSRVIYRGTSR
ncbi:MAG: hypothetical protein ASUL_08789 [Candidatus Aramenus sulfurataquae]|uniref:DUF308 domain-containing protein n=3 Tax=Candidatus Aramenus sulfurataquae TaxID=1326980 RepID=W7KH84_9CREN|nr:MAG: hypothetical protein ASUL_08789 [Candidatus Aramenus sulfurataquae]MCL7344605.1 hypothetical protein [Candidatus Aramenus sulfurataquae]